MGYRTDRRWGAVTGAIVGGLLSFGGIVYATKRDRDAARRTELLAALQAYAFATDMYAAQLERLPPADQQSRIGKAFFGSLMKALIGGERSQYLFAQALMERLFPKFKADSERVADRYTEASSRLALIGPPQLVDVLRRLTECFLKWQSEPGPGGLEEFGPLRRELTMTGRELLRVEALQQSTEQAGGG